MLQISSEVKVFFIYVLILYSNKNITSGLCIDRGDPEHITGALSSSLRYDPITNITKIYT